MPAFNHDNMYAQYKNRNDKNKNNRAYMSTLNHDM